MSLLYDDPLTQLAFSVHENPKVYALLIGSGLSQAASIPTGWDITLDLIRKVAAAKRKKRPKAPEVWDKDVTGNAPNYSELLAELGGTRAERRSILQGYIEPNAEDVQEGRRVPTKAHHAVARLVQDGYVRTIVTTNFDRLLEQALQKRNVVPTVISSPSMLASAQPMHSSDCFLPKLHGDYKEESIRNTEKELENYPAKFRSLLARIFDEHGLIVCGWSGAWDTALCQALKSSPSRRYSTYWAARGKLGDQAQDLVNHRGARVIRIDDADSFFDSLQQRVSILKQSVRNEPKSVDLLIASVKRFASRKKHRVRLHDLFADETRALTNKLKGTERTDDLGQNVAILESLTEPLAKALGVLGRWSRDDTSPNAPGIIRKVWSQRNESSAIQPVQAHLRGYPVVLLFTAFGLGLTQAERWEALHAHLSVRIEDERPGAAMRAVDKLFLWAWERVCYALKWQEVPGATQGVNALSDYLCNLFRAWSEPHAADVGDFDHLFDTWEFLASLAYLERYDKDRVRQVAEGKHEPSYATWVPLGRGIGKSEVRERLYEYFGESKTQSQLLDAGFSGGDPDFLELSLKCLDAMVSEMRRLR